MFQSYTRRSSILYRSHITWIIVKWYIWSLLWKWKMPLRKRQLAFLPIFHGPTKLRHCVGLYGKRPNFTWLPLGCLLVHQSLFYIFDCGPSNQGIRPYADIWGACMCTVYADVLRRSQTVIEPCTEKESLFLYNLEWSVCVFVCTRERKIYVHMTHECADVQ